jgi:uncharacterized membrane protein
MQRQLKLEHIISFADAIFAFSITFMAVTIDIPKLTHNLTKTQVIDEFLKSIPEFEIYVISFFVIGVYWIAYHQIFNQIVNSSTTVTWLTLAFLFFITLIPFATNLQVGFGYHLLFVLFALVLAMAGALLTITWLHATKNKLIDKSLAQREIHSILLEGIIPTIIYFLSILISFIDLKAAYYFWIAIIPAKIILHKKYPS